MTPSWTLTAFRLTTTAWSPRNLRGKASFKFKPSACSFICQTFFIVSLTLYLATSPVELRWDTSISLRFPVYTSNRINLFGCVYLMWRNARSEVLSFCFLLFFILMSMVQVVWFHLIYRIDVKYRIILSIARALATYPTQWEYVSPVFEPFLHPRSITR